MLGSIIMRFYLKRIERKGFRHGTNFDIEKGVNIDSAFCNLISCGNNVTLAKDTYILAHDASIKKYLGKTKMAKVQIGNNVFVGAGTIILPGVTIGDNVVIATNSSVAKDIPSGEVWGGVPAHYIMSTDAFLERHRNGIMNETRTKYKYID